MANADNGNSRDPFVSVSVGKGKKVGWGGVGGDGELGRSEGKSKDGRTRKGTKVESSSFVVPKGALSWLSASIISQVISHVCHSNLNCNSPFCFSGPVS